MNTQELIEQLSYHHEGIHGCHQELHELIPVLIHQLKAGQKALQKSGEELHEAHCKNMFL